MGSLQQSELQYPETPHEQLSTTFTEGQTRQNIEFVVPMYVEYCLHRLCQWAKHTFLEQMFEVVQTRSD